MVEYNTAMPKLEMREYGRHIQNLISHCITIPEREERNKCARAIAEIMINQMPEHKGEDINDRKVWDHINIIADFKLDIDFPCEVLTVKEMRPKPEKVPYFIKSEKYRVYGANLVKMIKEISHMEGGVDKDQMIFLIANQMKKLLINVNADSATDQRVFNDIREISGGRIDIDPNSYRLNEYIGITPVQDNKKKKKK